MSDTDAPEPAEDWATLERQDRSSALYVDTSDAGVLLCRACSVLHRCRLGIASEALAADESVRSDLACPVDHEGGPDVAHGGWTASVLDEMSGHALLLRDEFAVTGTLTVKFVKPVPIGRRLIGRAWIAEREGRRVHVSAELRLRDTNDLLATSAAVMIRRPGDHFDQHQSWLSTR
jgi:acyl-coenzyme A thioesterase PaaI-like protein